MITPEKSNAGPAFRVMPRPFPRNSIILCTEGNKNGANRRYSARHMARCASLAFTASQSGRKIAVSNHTAKRRIRLPKRGFCQTGRSTPRPVSNAVVAHRNTPRLTNSAGYVIMEMLQVQCEHRKASPEKPKLPLRFFQSFSQAEMLQVQCEHRKASPEKPKLPLRFFQSFSQAEMLQVQCERRIASPVLFHAETLYVRCEHRKALRAYSQSGNAVCFGQNTVCNRLNYTAPFKKHGYRSALGSFYSKTCVFSPF